MRAHEILTAAVTHVILMTFDGATDDPGIRYCHVHFIAFDSYLFILHMLRRLARAIEPCPARPAASPASVLVRTRKGVAM